jgi:hypothetical protein
MADTGNGVGPWRDNMSIKDGPHYEIASTELAAWLEAQQPPRWWNVDGDPLLTGRMYFPCSAALLAKELRKLNRPLLVQAKPDDTRARGELVSRDKIDELVERFADNLHAPQGGPLPPWGEDRFLLLCWKQTPDEWLLAEDSETTDEVATDGTTALDRK